MPLDAPSQKATRPSQSLTICRLRSIPALLPYLSHWAGYTVTCNPNSAATDFYVTETASDVPPNQIRRTKRCQNNVHLLNLVWVPVVQHVHDVIGARAKLYTERFDSHTFAACERNQALKRVRIWLTVRPTERQSAARSNVRCIEFHVVL